MIYACRSSLRIQLQVESGGIHQETGLRDDIKSSLSFCQPLLWLCNLLHNCHISSAAVPQSRRIRTTLPEPTASSCSGA